MKRARAHPRSTRCSPDSPEPDGELPPLAVWRRPAALTLLSLVPLVLLWIFGAARVGAPFGLIGLLFDHPWDYALAAAAVAAVSAVLMAIPAVDRLVGGALNGGDEPQNAQR